jgi:hypothetical protein
VIVRKNLTPQVMPTRIYPSTTINVLVVVTRSGEERDVGYRRISRPLVEMIETAKLHVQIDILRPGTYEALDRHLDEKPGFYHFLHFDLHGAVLSYDQVKKGVEREHLLYQRGYGLKDLQPFAGKKAFLAFESNEASKSVLVDAGEIAALLTGKGMGVPVCILNACQSGNRCG